MMRGAWLVVLGLLGACTTGADLAPRQPPALVQGPPVMFPAALLPRMSQDVAGSMMFLNRDLTLPEGIWKVAAIQSVSSKTTGLLGGVVALVRIEGTRLRGVLVLAGNAKPFPHGFPISPTCQSSDVIWNDVRQAVPQGDQDCATINFERPALWRAAQKSIFPGIIGALDLLNVQPPNFLVGVMAHEANRNWTLDEVLYENPDVAGITPDPSTQRALSGWTAFRLPSDPARGRFVDDLKARAALLRAALRRQIEIHAPFIPNSGLTPA